MSPIDKKRQADFQVIAQGVEPGERVLDLGCGRGVLLEYLKQKTAYAMDASLVGSEMCIRDRAV